MSKTVNTCKVVKERTYEVAEEMKKRIEPLIERAFMTGAFDCDEACELPPPKGRGFLIQRLRLPCAFAQGRGANLQRREFRQFLPY